MTSERRPAFPLVSTIVVTLAVAAMVALGVWQIARAHEKDALLARYHRAATLPPITWPSVPPRDDRLLFRRAAGFCVQVTGWLVTAGRSRGDEPGWRHIAQCRTGGPNGRGMMVDAGWSRDWQVKPSWHGGPIAGVVTTAPDTHTLIGILFDHLQGLPVMVTPMLVLDNPAPGLTESADPNPDDIPHNHRAYAVQWFSFAAIAFVIYVIALLKRRRSG